MLESWNLTHLVIAGLAIARITSLIVLDDLLEPIRHRVFMRSPSQAYIDSGVFVGDPKPRTLGSLLACYHCVGAWVAIGAYAAMRFSPDTTVPVLAIAALAQISDTAIKHSR